VAKLLAAAPRHPALVRYRDLVASGVHGGSLRYRGSPLLALQALRAVDRAVFFETQREEAGNLRKLLDSNARARVEGSDGFAGLRALLPPPERRGCVLIDPPYEERVDFTLVHATALDALTRFEGAVLVLWLPLKLRSDFDAWFTKLRRALPRPVLGSLLWMHQPDSRAALNGSGLVVVNPPYLLEEGMREWLQELRALLGGERSGCEILPAT
jgi:23S rRNA (adenine2030-N6)-methyltransferase